MRRVGIDVGGTFTDLVSYDDESKTVSRAKSSTTPGAPEVGVLNVLGNAGINRSELDAFLHATTLVTNLILTRAGARVGLITTKGFRDVLDIGLSYKQETYDLQWRKPKPFAPRHLVHEVEERVDHLGHVLIPLNESNAIHAIHELMAREVEAIAICLFNSYVNPIHELALERIVRRLAPRISVSVSSTVDPRIREYQRVSTTVLNAYAMPRVEHYVGELGNALPVPIRYMHSAGGVTTGDVVRQLPVVLLASGPAAGVLGGRFVAEQIGVSNIITADVGGTSFDVCVVRGGTPTEKDVVEVEWGIPARVPSIDVSSIGAGGGSIAWIDDGGSVRVGPQSAGAVPGPACYGLGGSDPTVTDANLVIGILDTNNPLAGQIQLDLTKARSAIAPIARRLKISVEDAALGIYRLVNARMAQAIHESTVRKGIDPREFVMVAFGGAGGQHAAAVAAEVGIPKVVYPANASALSAFGLLTANLKSSATKTLMTPLKRIESRTLANELRALEQAATRPLAGEAARIDNWLVERSVRVRYVGQSNEVSVNVGQSNLSASNIYEQFQRTHQILYGTRLDDPAEVVDISVAVIGVIPRLTLRPSVRRGKPNALHPREVRRLSGYRDEVPVFARQDLTAGLTLPGPCIVQEIDTVVFIPPDCVSKIDRFGNIITDLVPNRVNH